MNPDKLNVLIAEDSSLFRAMISDALLKEGYEVTTAVDGNDAVQKLSLDKRYDLLMLDLQMPNMNGIELLEYYQNGSNKAALPPTLIITSSTPDPTFLMKLRKLGAKGYIIKSQPTHEIIFRIKSITGSGEDKRRDMRELLNIPIEYSIGSSFLSVRTFDFAKNSAFIATTNPTPVGKIINLRFTLPTVKQVFSTRGKVMFIIKYDTTNKGTYPPGMGINFLDLTEDDQSVISKYLAFVHQKKK